MPLRDLPRPHDDLRRCFMPTRQVTSSKKTAERMTTK